jgi:hypothetical protein
MDALNSSSFTAFVGIDLADSKHDSCLQGAGCEHREFDIIPHKVERIDEWVQSLHRRFGGPIAVAIELSKGPVVYALQKYAFLLFFPVDLILRHPERFKPLHPQSVEMRMLASLVEQRRNLVDAKTRITNRLRVALKQYYPQILEWFDHIDTRLCDRGCIIADRQYIKNRSRRWLVCG